MAVRPYPPPITFKGVIIEKKKNKEEINQNDILRLFMHNTKFSLIYKKYDVNRFSLSFGSNNPLSVFHQQRMIPLEQVRVRLSFHKYQHDY